MKKLLVLLACIILSYTVHAQGNVNVTFKFIFINSKAGFTYDSKLVLERNGVKVGESKIKNQELLNEATFSIPKDNATLKATIYALYNGKWEARTKNNGYSFDCVYEKNKNWDKNESIKITVDIEKNDIIIDENASTNNNTYSNNSSNDNLSKAAKERLEMQKQMNSSNNTSTTTTSNNYNSQTALQKLNKYLKTFDNGYYGYLEVVGNKIYTRFKSGEYCEANINDLDKAVEVMSGTKVAVKCKSGNCVFSTYTNSKHEQMSFSQNTSFNTQELITLLNNALAECKNKPTSTTTNNVKQTTETNKKTTDDDDDYWEEFAYLMGYSEGEDSNTESKVNGSGNYQTALDNLNKYLLEFNRDIYRNIKVENGNVNFTYNTYSTVYTTSISIADLKKATVVKVSNENKVKIMCSGASNCFSGGWNPKSDHFQFFPLKPTTDVSKIKTLIEDFIKAL
ncbi:MAG: hypothetical protein IPK18_09300 [Sphingobacteriales bacterium]|nr:MAG: hypothetical protein IPK18_09300 [Sphingobacteriales bacterium]